MSKGLESQSDQRQSLNLSGKKNQLLSKQSSPFPINQKGAKAFDCQTPFVWSSIKQTLQANRHRNTVKAFRNCVYSSNHLQYIKRIQRQWRQYTRRQQKQTQDLRNSSFRRNREGKCPNKGEVIELMIMIIKTVCFANCFQLTHKTDYLIRKKALDFLRKSIRIQTAFKRYYGKKHMKNPEWENYSSTHKDFPPKRPILIGYTFKKYSFPLSIIIKIQTAVSSFLLNKKTNKRSICRLQMKAEQISISRVNKSRLSEAIFASNISLRPKASKHSYYTKRDKASFDTIIDLQRAITKFVAIKTYKRAVKVIPLQAREREMFITKHLFLSPLKAVIMIQTDFKLFLIRKNKRHLRFNKTILRPSNYTKSLIIGDDCNSMTRKMLIKETRGKCEYFVLKVMIIVSLAMKRIGFTMLSTDKNRGKRLIQTNKCVKKPVDEWSYSSNSHNSSSNTKMMEDWSFNDAELPEMDVHPINRFNPQLFKIKKGFLKFLDR